MTDIERLKARIFDGVLDHGHIVQFISATVAHSAPRAYTIGRTLLDRPEFVVAGLELAESKQLLDALVAWDDLSPLEEGGEAVITDLNVRLQRADPLVAVGAIITFGQCTLLQAVWRDPAGRRVAGQPMLGEGQILLRPGSDPYGDIE